MSKEWDNKHAQLIPCTIKLASVHIIIVHFTVSVVICSEVNYNDYLSVSCELSWNRQPTGMTITWFMLASFLHWCIQQCQIHIKVCTLCYNLLSACGENNSYNICQHYVYHSITVERTTEVTYIMLKWPIFLHEIHQEPTKRLLCLWMARIDGLKKKYQLL